ncbi:hypothetical protein BASA62_001104 [Batrachochytrium salamandrivorans]|nr:hypothetical protein BASA62_001104 [Batrachochytrium salamandrivorans]
MRLISFAVISLLTITVSAHPPPSTSAANDAPQCDKDVITQKIQELTAAHQEQQELITKLEEPGKAEQEKRAIKSVMKTIRKQLKRKDLSEDEKWDLQKHYAESANDLKKAENALIPKQKQVKEAVEQRYDAKSKGKTEVSPGSSSYKDTLQKQIDETFYDASDLSAADQGVKEGVDKLNDVIKRTKNPKISKLDKTWDKLTGTRKKLARESIVYARPVFSYKRAPVGLYWPSQNSLAVRLYQSLWQTFGMNTERLERQSKQTHWRIRQNYRHRRPDQPRPTAPPPPPSRQILAVNVANISNKRPAIRHIVRNTRLWAISEICITSSNFRFTIPEFVSEREGSFQTEEDI